MSDLSVRIISAKEIKGFNATDVSHSSAQQPELHLAFNKGSYLTPSDFIFNFGFPVSKLALLPNQFSPLIFAVILHQEFHSFCTPCTHLTSSPSFFNFQIWSLEQSQDPLSLFFTNLPYGCPRTFDWLPTFPPENSPVRFLSIILGNGNLLIGKFDCSTNILTEFLTITVDCVQAGFRCQSVNFDMNWIILGSDDGKLVIFDTKYLIENFESQTVSISLIPSKIVITLAESPINNVVFDPHNPSLLTASTFDCNFYLVNLADLRTISKVKFGLDPITSLSWSLQSKGPNVSSSLGQSIYFDGHRRQFLKHSGGLTKMIDGAKFLQKFESVADFLSIFSGGEDGFLRFLSIRRVKMRTQQNYQIVFTGIARDTVDLSRYVTTPFENFKMEAFQVTSTKALRVAMMVKAKSSCKPDSVDLSRLETVPWTGLDLAENCGKVVLAGSAGVLGRILFID
ncbi:hypothetical protein RCL1_005051 [Eukaryota sp. TZLM3-RCL]